MRRLRLAGTLWIIGGVLSALLVLVTLDVPGIAVLVAAGGVVGIVIGSMLIRRPSAAFIKWSSIAGVGWLVAFGWLTVTSLDKPVGELLTGVVLLAFGVLGAVVAYSGRAEVAPAR